MKNQQCPRSISELPLGKKGCPPIMMELDAKLIQFLRAVCTKGGVINASVVRAAATALIVSNPTTSQQLIKFDMPCSWIQSIYQWIGFTRRIGTTARPPVPQGLFDECRVQYLRDIDVKVNGNKRI